MEDIEVAKQLRKPEGEAGKKIAEKMNETNQLIYNLTFDAMDNWESQKILEIGFGNGNFISHVINSFKNVYYKGLDFSATMVEEANIRNKDFILSGQVELKKGESSSIPYPDVTFDKVFTINTLYFWENPENDLNEIYRVLKSDGMFYLSIRTKDKMKNLPFTQYNFQLYNPEEATEVLEKSGFNIINKIYKIEPIRMINGVEVLVDSLCIVAQKQ